jgi:hypothetical protein
LEISDLSLIYCFAFLNVWLWARFCKDPWASVNLWSMYGWSCNRSKLLPEYVWKKLVELDFIDETLIYKFNCNLLIIISPMLSS